MYNYLYLLTCQPISGQDKFVKILQEEKKENKHCFFAYFLDYIEKNKNLCGWSKGYIRSYKSEINKWKGFRKQLFIEDITEDVISGFIEYMQVVLGNDVNTIYRTNKRSRRVFKEAKKKKIICENPYEDVKLKQVQKIPIHLTITELTALEELKKRLSTEKEYKHFHDILNYFLFICYTGLRYQTLESLTYKEIYDL